MQKFGGQITCIMGNVELVHKFGIEFNLVRREFRLFGKRKRERQILKTESTRKLNNFNSQWTKTLNQNNLKNIAFFFTFFKG